MEPLRLPSNPETLVVIQTAFVGDIALTSSFLAGLRTLAPSARIVLLTTPAGARLLEPNPWRIEILPYDKRGREKGLGGFLRKARELRALHPKVVFCLHRSFRSTLLARATGAETYGFAEAAGAFLLHHRRARKGKTYEAEKNLALLEAWAGEAARGLSAYPSLALGEAEVAEARQLVGGQNPFVAIAPSSVWATKRWPVERFAQVAEELGRKHGLRTVIVGGSEPHDLELGRRLAALVPGSLDLSGRTSLGLLKAVLAEAKLVVANDSAPLHLALAVGTRALGIFGPTTKDLGFFPLAPPGQSGVVELTGLSCRPCGLHGHNACPERHFRCMLDLSPEKVYAEAEKLLC